MGSFLGRSVLSGEPRHVLLVESRASSPVRRVRIFAVVVPMPCSRMARSVVVGVAWAWTGRVWLGQRSVR